jgi:hypothetical protein
MKRAFGWAALLALASGNLAAETMPVVTWVQTSSSAGDCATCEITTTFISPNIMRIDANTGWVGYGHYRASDNSFHGAFEFTNGEFENVVILSDFTI